LVHCWYSLGRSVTICTQMVSSVFDDWYSVPFLKNSQKTVKTAKITIGVPIVTCLPKLYQQCTNRQKQSKTGKRQSNSKKMTIGVPIVTCLHTVRRIHKAAQTPLPCETSMTRAWAVATARRPWAGLIVCIYIDVHASGSRSLPRAATLSSTY